MLRTSIPVSIRVCSPGTHATMTNSSVLTSPVRAQIKAKQMCRAIKMMGAQHLCSCACPAAASSRRNTFAYMSQTCSMDIFSRRLANVSKACCGPCATRLACVL